MLEEMRWRGRRTLLLGSLIAAGGCGGGSGDPPYVPTPAVDAAATTPPPTQVDASMAPATPEMPTVDAGPGPSTTDPVDPVDPVDPIDPATPVDAGLDTGMADPITPPDAGEPGTDAASDAGDAAPPEDLPPRCTGKPGQLRGRSEQSVEAGGQRTFVYYAPETLDPDQPVPLVIVPHGFTMSGEAMYEITRYAEIADREGFVAIFPDGAPFSIGPWDVGSNICGAGASVPGSGQDQKFVDEMIAFAEADQCLDREHIFMTGFSMGGYFSNHNGCLRDDIRAIGPHSAGSHGLDDCPVARKPVILFHFDPDALIDYQCGVEARDRWIAKNGCDPTSPEVRPVNSGSCEYYRGCPEDGQVAFCTFQIPEQNRGDFLAGHAWAGGEPQAFSIEGTESAAELGWEFFRKYAW